MTLASANDLKDRLRSLSIDPPAVTPQDRRTWLIAAGVVPILVAAALAARGGVWLPFLPASSEPAAAKPLAATAEPDPALPPLPVAPPPVSVIGSGYVVAPATVAIRAQIGGQIAAVPVEAGQHVTSGQVLVVFDTSKAELAARIAQSNLAMAESQVSTARAELAESLDPLHRTEQLARSGYASQEVLFAARLKSERLQRAVEVREHERDSAALAVEQARHDVNRHLVRAPFNGVVTNLVAVPGMVVSSGENSGSDSAVLMTLVDLEKLYVDVDVSEANIAGIAPGRRASVVLDAYPGKQIQAAVLFIDPAASRQKGTVTLRLAIAGAGRDVLANMAAKVAFAAPAEAQPARSLQNGKVSNE